jgi:serine/threonine protein kinase
MTDTELKDIWIDEVADRFAEAWRAGSRPRIEDFLTGPTETGRATLLVELVCVEVVHRRASGEEPALAEYLARFPENAPAVEAGFEAARGPGPAPDTKPLPPDVDAQMLLGILALQHNFTDRDALLAAFNTWVMDKTRGLGAILVERGALTAKRLELLETLAGQILEQHGGDPSRSLASRGTLDAIRHALVQLHDAELDAALTMVSVDPSLADPAGTTATAPDPSAAGIGPHARERNPAQPFRVIRKINRGGQGDIYLAQDVALNRKVALKRIKEQYTYLPTCQARLLIEAEVAGRLEHPGFLPVHTAGFDDKGRPYFVMRFIDGNSSFTKKIDEFHSSPTRARPPDERAPQLWTLLKHFIDVCYAVAYAHNRGVLHRDIKPANVLVGNFGETYLVDWGLVKFIGRPTSATAALEESLRPPPRSSVHRTGGVVGTLPYLSPEQLEERALGPATDVYGLGAMLYTLLTGRLAFPSSDRTLTEADIKAGRFVPPRAAGRRVPAALEAVCLKAMALRAEDRYASAKELARDVEDWQADRPIAVYREPWPRRAARWARNHKPAVAGAAVLVFTSIVYLVVNNVLVGLERAETEKNFRLARNAVWRLVNLAGVPRSETVRREIADTALNSTSSFLASRPSDPRVRFDAARVYHANADIGRMIGRFDEPLHLYQAAAVLLDRLVGKLPVDELIAEWAMNIIDTGELFRTSGRPVASKAYFQRVLDALEKSGGPRAESQSRRRLKAIALLKLASAHNDTGHHQEARKSASLAIDLLTPLAGEGVDRPGEAQLLLMAQDQLGVAERAIENHQGSDNWFALAIQRGNGLRNAGHDSPETKHALACVLNDRAQLLAADPKRQIEARDEFNKAGLILSSLVDEHPHIPLYRMDLAIAYHGRAAIHLVLGRECLQNKSQKLAQFHLTSGKEFCEKAASHLSACLENRNLSSYHNQLGRTLTTLAGIVEAQGDPVAARTLRNRAVNEQQEARKARPPGELDRELPSNPGD